MTKIHCGCIKCKYNKEGICTSKEISLAHNSVLTVYEGRKEYNSCNNKEDSAEYLELQEKMRAFLEVNNANNSK